MRLSQTLLPHLIHQEQVLLLPPATCVGPRLRVAATRPGLLFVSCFLFLYPSDVLRHLVGLRTDELVDTIVLVVVHRQKKNTEKNRKIIISILANYVKTGHRV